MSRSGYSEDCDYLNLYRATVDRAIAGKRGQAFLKELASALDAMPEKRLIVDELIAADGEVCAIGAVCKARGVNVSLVDYDDPGAVGYAVGIATCLAAEIEFINDDDFCGSDESPEDRWKRVRAWVARSIITISPT